MIKYYHDRNSSEKPFTEITHISNDSDKNGKSCTQHNKFANINLLYLYDGILHRVICNISCTFFSHIFVCLSCLGYYFTQRVVDVDELWAFINTP